MTHFTPRPALRAYNTEISCGRRCSTTRARTLYSARRMASPTPREPHSPPVSCSSLLARFRSDVLLSPKQATCLVGCVPPRARTLYAARRMAGPTPREPHSSPVSCISLLARFRSELFLSRKQATCLVGGAPPPPSVALRALRSSSLSLTHEAHRKPP